MTYKDQFRLLGILSFVSSLHKEMSIMLQKLLFSNFQDIFKINYFLNSQEKNY